MSLVRKQWVTWSLISCGAVFLLLLLAFLIFAYHFAGENKTRLIRESTSPDGQFVAEINEVITPMNGGPDLVQVLLRPVTRASGEVVYSQTFECESDNRAFQVRWRSPKNLEISYGVCDTGRYHTAADNKFFQKITEWHEVSIAYLDSEHVAHAKP